MKLLIVGLLIFTHQVFPQKLDINHPGTPEQRAKMTTDTMKIRLKLTPPQEPLIYALNLKYAQIMEKEVIETNKSSFSKYWKGNGINNKKESELVKILTPIQYKEYEKMKSEKMKKILSSIF
jgi:hypothetical protein